MCHWCVIILSYTIVHQPHSILQGPCILSAQWNAVNDITAGVHEHFWFLLYSLHGRYSTHNVTCESISPQQNVWLLRKGQIHMISTWSMTESRFISCLVLGVTLCVYASYDQLTSSLAGKEVLWVLSPPLLERHLTCSNSLSWRI